MEVIYRKNIIEKMQEAIEEARRKRKDIEVIRLTKEEWAEMKLLMHGTLRHCTRRELLLGDECPNMFMGVRIEKAFEDF